MIEATQKQINDFIKYRSQHIALVERIGQVVFNENFSDHDFDKCTADAKELNLLALRNAMLNGDYSPVGEMKYQLNKLPGKHVKLNKHHPEYWDDSIKAKNWNEANPPQVHASRMPKKYLCELACDWAAVALKRNQPIFSWYNKVCTGDNPRFIFTENQKKYLIECLTKIMDKIHKEKLYYPGRSYTAEQIEPVIDLNEKSAFLNEMESIMEYTKKEFIDDVNKIEQEAAGQFKREENPIRKASAEGKIVACEDVKDLARNLPGDYIPDSIGGIYESNAAETYFGVESADGNLITGTIFKDIEKVRQLRADFASKFKDVFRIRRVSKEEFKESLNCPFEEKIVKEGSKWKVVSEDGSKSFGVFDTEKEAEKRLRQVHYFKHINEELEPVVDESSEFITQLGNFFLKNCTSTLNNYERDRLLLAEYRELEEDGGISEEGLKDIVSDKEEDLARDFAAIKELLALLSQDTFELKKSRVFNELLTRLELEKELKLAARSYEENSSKELQEEVGAAVFSSLTPERVSRVIKPLS